MRVPLPFREGRPAVLVTAMRELQAAVLTMASPAGPEAVHLPLVVADGSAGLLVEGQVAGANPPWRLAAGQGTAALAIFQGLHAYVHPGWYEARRVTGRAMPTPNYLAIHARGRLTAVADEAWLRAHPAP